MKKLLISLTIIAAVAAVLVGATTAFFSDTETSTGNTFTAGSIDLKIDNECHWSGGTTCPWHEVEMPDGTFMKSDWQLTDLEDGVHKFAYFTDLKPGDWGEDTISIHVYDNDAWGRVYLSNIVDAENDCTEPELEDEPNCASDTNGELDNYLEAMVWLDQGMHPGFQCPADEPRCAEDPEEGDNIHQMGEPVVFTNFVDLSYDLAGVIMQGYIQHPDAPGLTEDGHMVGSITYYIGLSWCFGEYEHGPDVCNGLSVDNSSQTDSLGADITFEAEQYRNNPVPSWR